MSDRPVRDHWLTIHGIDPSPTRPEPVDSLFKNSLDINPDIADKMKSPAYWNPRDPMHERTYNEVVEYFKGGKP